ncbi:MAG: O-antigen ligase family protein [Patescibacteria group bacterium]
MLDSKKIEKFLLAALEGVIYLSFLMPFIFIDSSIFPFIVGKILYFQAAVQLMALIYIVLLVINFNQYKPKKNLLFYWFGFYALTLLLSAIFGVDFQRAFWSNFERMTGVFVVFHFIAYSIIVSVVFSGEERVKKAIKVLLAVSLIQVAVVAAQYVKPGVFLYENVGGRVWGTLGNSIYIGSYFLFHIFFALYLAFKEKKQIWQIIYLSIAILESYIIIHSRSSRGADLAFGLAAIFIIFSYAFLSKNKKIRIATISVVIIGVLGLTAIYVLRNTEMIKSNPYYDKISELSLNEGTGRTRTIAWKIAWTAFLERPVLGWGLENFYYAFNKYYNPESLRYSYYETWFDRSHSVVFDTLYSGGAMGTVSYFGLFAVGGILLFLAWKKGQVDRHAMIFFTAIFATYLIQILFVFDHPASYFLIYLSFGLLLGLLSGKREDVAPKYEFSGFLFFLISLGAIIIFFSVFFSTSIRTYKAATGIIDAERKFVNNYKVGLDAYKDILSLKTSFKKDMVSVMAKRIMQISPEVLKNNPQYSEALLLARNEVISQVEERGIDVYDYLILGQIDMLLAASDPKYYDSAEVFFAKARELSPKRQQVYFTWAREKMMRGDNAGAIELLKEAYAFDEKVPDSSWYLGLAYNQDGNKDLAWDYTNKAFDLRYTWKAADELYFLIGLGERLKKDQDLPSIYLKAIEQFPSAELYAGLGNVYYRLGMGNEALEAFAQAEKINPEIFNKK